MNRLTHEIPDTPVKEFATKVRMASSNVLRAINPRHNPTQDTLNRLLKPFRLRLSLAAAHRKGPDCCVMQ